MDLQSHTYSSRCEFESHFSKGVGSNSFDTLSGRLEDVIYCTNDMVRRSLWEAMHTAQESLEEVEVKAHFLTEGLKPAAFAALVPNSANKPLQELMEDFMGDHEMLTGEQL
ncbi:vacuolar acid trehalase [Trifolium repens]|nr:vacuolar acid trehalase [Trifolium repens]